MSDKNKRTNESITAESMGAGVTPAPDARPATVKKELPPERVGVTRSKAEAFDVELARIGRDPQQPRTEFDPEDITNLANSLKRDGQIQNIALRWMAKLGVYYIVTGERRVRAAREAGLKTLVATIVSDQDAEEIYRKQLVENLLRRNLKGIEQAHAYARLMKANKMTAAELAKDLNISESMVSRALGLLETTPEVQEALRDKKISPTAGAEIAKLHDPELQNEVAEKVIGEKLGVEETKAVVEEAKARDIEKPREERKRGGQRGKGKGKKTAPGLKSEWTFKAEGGYVVTVSRKKGVEPDKREDALRQALLASSVQIGDATPAEELATA